MLIGRVVARNGRRAGTVVAAVTAAAAGRWCGGGGWLWLRRRSRCCPVRITVVVAAHVGLVGRRGDLRRRRPRGRPAAGVSPVGVSAPGLLGVARAPVA